MAEPAPFAYRDGQLYCEDVPASLIAESHGTPAFVYSSASLVGRYRAIREAFARWSPLVCFSVKSCSNLSVLQLLAREGCGFDVVSGGELYRAVRAGARPERIVYAGAGKTPAEMEFALRSGIGMFNVESRPELVALDAVARGMGVRARVALRINPDVDARTHAKTTTGKAGTKFGISLAEAEALALEAGTGPAFKWPGCIFTSARPFTRRPLTRLLWTR